MAISPDESTIALAEDNLITLIENPLNCTEPRVYGPGDDYMNFMRYVSQIIMDETPVHDPNMDSWIIQPYRLNTMHYYAYYNLPKHLKLGILSNAPFIISRHGETPLSLGIKKDFSNCIFAIFNVYDKLAQKNIYAFNSFENSIVPLNDKGFLGLDKFYKIILPRSKDSALPKFCNENIKLPITIQSDYIIPKAEDFMPKENYSSNGKAIMFLQTLIRLNLTLGSKDSLEFLDSLEDCPETSIFKTRIIKTILREK